MSIPCIFNIQKFSSHDGPGIRTTVFFKSCPMRCLWCHNPESQRPEPEQMRDKDGKEQWMGKQYEIPELVRILAKDQIFYDQSGGGVTLSGGEVMVQDMEYILSLLKALERQGISVVIDTCGLAPRSAFEQVLPYTELFLYDLKVMDPQLHKQYTRAELQPVLDNLEFLGKRGAAINLRLIMVPEVNMSLALMERIDAWLKEKGVRVSGISLLPYHDFGRDKYPRLGRECTQNFRKPTEAELEGVKEFWLGRGYTVSIGG